jgi:hypothetical protein
VETQLQLIIIIIIIIIIIVVIIIVYVREGSFFSRNGIYIIHGHWNISSIFLNCLLDYEQMHYYKPVLLVRAEVLTTCPTGRKQLL